MLFKERKKNIMTEEIILTVEQEKEFSRGKGDDEDE